MYAGQVLAKISADTTGLKRGVQESTTLLRSLSSSAQAAGKSGAASMTAMEKSVAQLNRGLVQAKGTFLGFTAAAGVMSFVQRAVGAAKSAMIDFNSTLEQATIGFTTMLGSAKQADAYLSKMMEFAARTPFQFQELVGASQRLLALGFAANKIEPTLRAVGDTVAALGGTMDYQGQIIIRALGQMQAKGKVSAEEMMQLSEAGISAWQYLADQYNTTTADMMNRTRKTVVDSGTAVTAILKGMSQDFGGMMDAQSKTLQGAFSTVLDYTSQTVAAMTKPMYEKMRDTFLKLADYLSGREFRTASANFGKIISGGMSKAFDVMGKAITALKPIAMSVFESISAHKGDLQDLASQAGEFLSAIGEAAMTALKFGAAIAKMAPSTVIIGLQLFVSTLNVLADIVARNETLIRTLLFIGFVVKINSWIQASAAYIVKLSQQAAAHLAAAAAAKTQAVAETQLAAAQTRGSSMGMPGGAGYGVPALQKTQTTMKQTQSLGKNMTGALRNGFASLGAAINPVTVGIGLFSVGMLTAASSAKRVQEETDKLVASVTAGTKDMIGKWQALEEAKTKALPTKRDMEYSGGFWSDAGAAFGNVFGDFDAWTSNDSKTTDAMNALNEEQQKILDDITNSQADSLAQINSDVDKWADDTAQSWADAKDGVSDAMQALIDKQGEMFLSMADPFKNFADQQGVDLETMMTNMTANLTAMQSYQENLAYLLGTGNTDIAAYFASLGPMSNQAMSELVHGTPQQMDEFRKMMTGQWEAAGVDAQSAINDGLSKIPGLAADAGIDMAKVLNEQAMAAAKPALVLDYSYRTAFGRIKDNVSTSLRLAFDPWEQTQPDFLSKVDALSKAFASIKPEDLVDAGITPTALGIPQVQEKLAELAQQGVTDPLTIATNVQDVLDDMGKTKAQIDALVQTDPEIKIVLDQFYYNDTIDQIEAIKTTLETMVDNPYAIPIDVYVRTMPAQITPPSSSDPNRAKYGLPDADVNSADGNFLPQNASVHHGSTLFQWGEPETGGEAFIPLGANKRKRSLDIWKQVGKQFGMLAFGGGGIVIDGNNSGANKNYAPSSSGVPKPSPWSFKSQKKKSSGGGSASGHAASSMAGWDEVLANMYSMGDFPGSEYINYLSKQLDGLQKYSDAWKTITDQIASVQDEMVAEQRSREDVMNEFGATSNEAYLAILQQRLAGTTQFSDEWASAMREVQSFQEQMLADQEAMVDKQRSIEDNMYAVGDKGMEEYLGLLNERLSGLEKYSDEWTSLYQKIKGIEDQAAKDAASAAQDAADAIQEAADALQAAIDAIANPIKQATSLFEAFGDQDFTSFDQIVGFYDHMQEATQRWSQAIAQLRSAGLNAGMLSQLIQAGPNSLGFAESIIGAGQSGIDYINQQDAALGGIANTIGQNNSSLVIDVGGVQISVDASGQMIDTAELTASVNEAFAELANKIREGVNANG